LVSEAKMTVREMIEKLQAQKPEYQVIIGDGRLFIVTGEIKDGKTVLVVIK
jgi:hypothetical protein